VEHPAVRAIRPGRAGDEKGLELHRVQMPPLSLGSMILKRPLLPAFRTTTRGTGHMLEMNCDFLRRKIEVHIRHVPAVPKSQQPSIMFREILHGESTPKTAA